MTKRVGFSMAATAAAGFTAWKLKKRTSFDLNGKVVLVTGGSRGLGLQLAREFGQRGAMVVICARDARELDRAQEDLTQRNIIVRTIPCDVSQSEEAKRMVAEAIRVFGRIDVLVNNAGVIQVGPIEKMTVQDFEQAMAIMFWGTLYPIMSVLPSMRERGQGRIVNITSIGGKISVPHLIPYSCAKFATVALSEGLRTELAPFGIKVTTIVPGLMRTGSHLNARFKGNQANEYAWFSFAAATPLLSIGAERAARSIVESTIRGDTEKILSVPAGIAARLHGVLPELTETVASLINRFLPRPDGHGSHSETGSEARSRLNSRLLELLNSPGQRAAQRLNQLAG